jgi:hypothetical protein
LSSSNHKLLYTGAKLEGGYLTGLCSEKFFDPFFNFRKKIVQIPPPPTFFGKIVARNKNLLQGIIGFGRAIQADTPPP